VARAWAAAEVVLAGTGFRWSLGLLHLESPEIATGYDGNWIEAEVDLVIEQSGRFTARRRTTVLTTELIDFADSLATLLSTRTGSASLELTEDETGLVIHAVSDPGAEAEFDAEAFVRMHAGPELRAAELETSRRHLEETLHGVREAMRAFPPRGNPRD
jgi:hypothetical protein